MEKDFDVWNERKKQVNAERPRLYTVREIWWCKLGVNVGSEQDGNGKSFLRPVIIIRAFGPHVCAILPLTTSKKEHPLRVRIGPVKEHEASAILSQLRVIDTRRLAEKIGFLDAPTFATLRNAVRSLF